MANMRGALLLAAVGAALAACATDDDSAPPPPARHAGGEPRRRPPGGDGGEGRAALFVSPSGEPFRSKPGEPYPVARWFAQADADHDGKLDSAEFRADAARFFATLDVDGNGVLSSAEVSRYETEIVPEILGRHGRGFGGSADAGARRGRRALGVAQGGPGGIGGLPGGGGSGGGGGGGRGRRGGGDEGTSERDATPGDDSASEGAGPYGLLAEPEPVASSDLNFDGRITREEFLTRADQRFRALDFDGRGALTLAELPHPAAQDVGGRRRR